MDREKLKVLLEEIKDSDTDIVNWTMKSILGDLINALLEEPKLIVVNKTKETDKAWRDYFVILIKEGLKGLQEHNV